MNAIIQPSQSRTISASLFKLLNPQLVERWINNLSADELVALQYEWRYFWARENQLAPGSLFSSNPNDDWLIWLVLAGRGFGKTRTGAEWVRENIEQHGARRVALIGPTTGDVRDVMIEGESGLLAISPPWFRPVYEPSKRRLTWPNGAIATTFSAEEPDRLRGPQHDLLWGDETSSWRYPEAWDMAMFGLRLGSNPRSCVTTTPKPNKLTRDLMANPSTVITRGATNDNRENLAKAFLTQIVSKYEGTRLGRQELEAEILEDTPNALWTYKLIDATRINHADAPKMKRIVVAVDPSGTNGPQKDDIYADKSNDVGIAVCGLGMDGQGYMLEDLTINASPAVWGRHVVNAYHRHGADRVVAEQNFGGAMVEYTIRSVDSRVAYKQVTASRGKAVRAEPVAALYEQRKIHHIGAFAALETQMSQMTSNGYTGDGSPDRLDAMVWGFTELMLKINMPPPPVVGRAGFVRR